jgi:hypothetical protein
VRQYVKRRRREEANNAKARKEMHLLQAQRKLRGVAKKLKVPFTCRH